MGNIPVFLGGFVLPQEDSASNPTLAFGDGDTGFYESTDDVLRISIGGISRYKIQAANFSGGTGGFSLSRSAGTLSLPTYGIVGDTDTGMYSPSADVLALVTGGVASMVLGTIVTVSSGQINALAGTPIQVVAAPGSGNLIEFVSAVMVYDNGGTGYTVQADENLVIRYQDGSGTPVSETVETQGFIDQTNDEVRIVRPISSQDTDVTGNANQKLVIDNVGSGEFDGGNGVLDVRVTYRVHALGL